MIRFILLILWLMIGVFQFLSWKTKEAITWNDYWFCFITLIAQLIIL